MAAIASINPFPNDVRLAFQAYIDGPGYNNRERLPYEKWRQMHIYLDNPTLKPEGATESSLKHRALTEFELQNNKLYRQSNARHPNPRLVVPESEVFDTIANEHLQLLHAGRDKTWAAIQQKYYGINRQEVKFILKLCKNCALNRPAATKAPLQPIVTERAWERVQVDLIDMRHEPSGQYKWILHIKDHFSKYTQLYPLKSKHAQPIADAFALFIAAFLPPKIVQADNGKEFKGALLILLRKYGIQVINGAPRSPQTQGLIEQANGVVESKIRAWKMDNASTEWADGLLEVTLAINTQIHSTIGCAPAELLFRERTSYIDWLNSQMRKDPAIGVAQEDLTQAPICSLSQSSNSTRNSPQIDIGIQLRISPEISSAINVHITPPTKSPTTRPARNFTTKPISSPAEEWYDVETAPISLSPPVQLVDPVIQKAQLFTQNARARMTEKYSKRHDIDHFEVGDIVSLKVPREDRAATDNRRLFARVLEEPYSHRYKVITASGIIRRLIPTKELKAVDEALWSDIIIPDQTREVTLTFAAREASTSERVGISCQCKGLCNTKRCRCYKEDKECSVHCHRDEHDCGNLSGLVIRTEKGLVERPKRKRVRADTIGSAN